MVWVYLGLCYVWEKGFLRFLLVHLLQNALIHENTSACLCNAGLTLLCPRQCCLRFQWPHVLSSRQYSPFDSILELFKGISLITNLLSRQTPWPLAKAQSPGLLGTSIMLNSWSKSAGLCNVAKAAVALKLDAWLMLYFYRTTLFVQDNIREHWVILKMQSYSYSLVWIWHCQIYCTSSTHLKSQTS